MKTTLLFFTALFLFNFTSEAQTIYARQNGDWDDTDTWSSTSRTGASCSCIPSSTDDVIIDSYNIDVTNANAVANSVLFTNVSASGDRELMIENGYDLTISIDLELEANNNGDDVELHLRDNNSSLNIGGDLLIDMDNGERVTLNMDDASKILVDGDLSADMDGNSGEDLRFDLSCDSGTDHFHIAGNLLIDQDGAQEIQFNLSEQMQFYVEGDFTIDRDVAASNDQDIQFDMDDDASMRIEGSMDIDMNETVRSQSDILFDMNDNASIEVGMNDGTFLQSASISISDGDVLDFFMDEDAAFTVHGDMDMSQAGDGRFEIGLNTNNDGTTDCQWNVGRDLNIAKSDGDAFNMDLEEHSDLNVGDDFVIDITGFDGSGYDAELDLDDDAIVDVNGNFAFTMNVPNNNELEMDIDDNVVITVGVNDGLLAKSTTITVTNGEDMDLDFEENSVFTTFGNSTISSSGSGIVQIILDDDAAWNVDGNLSLTHNADEELYIYLNEYSNGSADDVQIDIGGNFTISKINGDAMHFRTNRDSDILVAGYMSTTISGHDASWQHDELQMRGASTIDVEENFTFSLNDTRSNNLIIDMDNESAIFVGVNDGLLAYTSTIEIIDGLMLDWDLDRDSHFETYGNVVVNHAGNGALNIDLNDNANGSAADAQFLTHGDLTITKTDGDRFRIEMHNDADMVVNGDLTYTSTGHDNGVWDDEYLEMRNDAILDVDGSLSFSMTDPSGQNDLNFDLDQNAAIYVGVDDGSLSNSFTLLNSNGYHSRIDLDRDAVFEVYGDADLTHDGTGTFDIHLNENANGSVNDGQLRIDGDWTIVKTDGDAFQLRVRNDSDIDLAGDFSYTSTNHDNGVWDDEQILLDGDATFDVDGSFNFSMDDPSNQNDITFTINNDAAMWVGVDDGSLTNNMDISITDGNAFNMDLDRNAILEVYGPVSIASDGVGNFDIDMNTNNGNGNDAQFRIDGNFNITKTNGDRFRLRLYDDADLDIGGNFVHNSSNHDNGVWGNETIIISNDATIDVDGSMTYTMNDATNQNYLNIDLNNNAIWTIGVDDGNLTYGLDIDEIDGRGIDLHIDSDAQFSVFGNMNIACNGFEYFDMTLNGNNNGAALLRVDGNLDIQKTDGGRFRVSAYDDALLDVGGNFTYSGTNHRNGLWDDEYLRLYNNAIMDVDGNLSWTVNDGTSQNDLYFDLNNDSRLDVGSSSANSAVLTMTDGYRLRIRIDNDAIWNVNGDLQLVYTDGSRPSDVSLNRSSGNNAQLNITGNFDIDNDKNSDLFYVRLDGSYSLLNVDGDIDMQSAAASNRIEIELNSTSKIEIGGSFIRSAAPNNFGILDCHDNSMVEYNGFANTQFFAEDAAAGSDYFYYENVFINNAYATAPQLTMEGLATIHGNITFRDGIVASSASDILVIEDNATSNAGVGSPAYSYVDGPIRKLGNDNLVFPLGNNMIWAPLEIKNLSGTSTFEAQYFDTAHADYTDTQAPLNNVSSVEYWTLERTSGSSSADVTLHWKDQVRSSINNAADLSVAHYNSGGQWEDLGQDNINYSDPGWIEVTNISTFSPFTFGSGSGSENPLPIELVSFNAQLIDDEVELKWVTASEVNNDYFTVERSVDGIEFEEVLIMPGAGNSTSEIQYSAMDTEPIPGVSYYRLRQTDFDGTTTLSNLVSINYNPSTEVHISLFPNPTNGNEISITLFDLSGKDLQLELFDISGKLVYSKAFQVEYDNERIDLGSQVNLQAGTYLLNIISGDIFESAKLFIK